MGGRVLEQQLVTLRACRTMINLTYLWFVDNLLIKCHAERSINFMYLNILNNRHSKTHKEQNIVAR